MLIKASKFRVFFAYYCFYFIGISFISYILFWISNTKITDDSITTNLFLSLIMCIGNLLMVSHDLKIEKKVDGSFLLITFKSHYIFWKKENEIVSSNIKLVKNNSYFKMLKICDYKGVCIFLYKLLFSKADQRAIQRNIENALIG